MSRAGQARETESIGPPPCDSCPQRPRCDAEKLACRDFSDYLQFGSPLIPAWLRNERRAKGTLNAPREPTATRYDRLFDLPKRKGPMKITLPDVRIAFASQLFEAKPINDGDPVFSSTFLFPPNSKAHKIVQDAIEQVAKDKWGAKAPAILDGLRKQERTCCRDGNLKTFDGYAGNLYVSAISNVRPLVVTPKREVIAAEDGIVYSGCYGNGLVEIWAQDNRYGKRVNAELKGFQFLRDGDAFSGGGRPADVEDFEDVSVGEESLVG